MLDQLIERLALHTGWFSPCHTYLVLRLFLDAPAIFFFLPIKEVIIDQNNSLGYLHLLLLLS